MNVNMPSSSSHQQGLSTVQDSGSPAYSSSAHFSPMSEETILPNDSAVEPPDIHYDPVELMDFYRSRPWEVWGRMFELVWSFLGLLVGLWWDKRTGSSEKKQRQRAIHLREILTRLGPAYIKVGQALSTRPDLLPPLFLEELTRLQDQLPPFPNEVAYQFIEEELGDRPEFIYAEISSKPVAAASLGQVYKGKLKSGETVAIKVQRPDLRERISLDLYILRSLAAWVQKNRRIRSDLVAIADEFGARIYEEMDYTHEGRNAERFEQLYGYIPDIYVPQIYWQYTNRRVLTMEWITGTKLTDLEKIRQQGLDASYLIEVGVECSLRQLLEHGFFHADPHPGNLLASGDGKLVYLDFGMMSEVKPYQRYGLIEAIVHLVNRDFSSLAQDYVKLEFLTPDTDLTPIIPALSQVFNDALGASVAELNFKNITDQLSQVMYDYPFRVPAYYALIIRSLVTLEGIAINVNPNFKVLSKAYPYVAKRLLTDQSPELRTSLRELLFKDGSFRWNRLENLLKNARNSQDYDLDVVLNQTIDFLFSDRGSFIRDRIVEEIVKSVDTLGRTTLETVSDRFRKTVGMNGQTPVKPISNGNPDDQKNLEHIQRILQIVQETQGFDPMKIVPLLPKVLLKPETQQMGQQIASGLAQRVLVRFIREVLLSEDGENGSSAKKLASIPNSGSSPLALPAAAVVSMES
ncbi:ABC1 kinase family protein [Roseofilum capinflatum]|uniref:AarF/ABC1/UbiB kinase family protein n=1 Tax=Roseofilum capinflatum BLCC-M114 TaxID=3022440 RepID=A0ABT7B8C5_9CYAN|nr:AarF/ABC1/UbiB kinase family protein [Roseofilum capinflatum]MDJ1175425.1 AarF/ABC1/UbiB kinase family protein [Roseofilum capinflatum BLCC-M114]